MWQLTSNEHLPENSLDSCGTCTCESGWNILIQWETGAKKALLVKKAIPPDELALH